MADEQKPAAAVVEGQAAGQTVEAEKLDIEKLTADITAAAVEAVGAQFKAQLAGSDRKISELTAEKETIEKAKLDESLTADEKLANLTKRVETSEREAEASRRAAETEKKVGLIKAEAMKRGLVDNTYKVDPELSLEDNVKFFDDQVKRIEELATQKANARLVGGTEPGSGNIADTVPTRGAPDMSNMTSAQKKDAWVKVIEEREKTAVPTGGVLPPGIIAATKTLAVPS